MNEDDLFAKIGISVDHDGESGATAPTSRRSRRAAETARRRHRSRRRLLRAFVLILVLAVVGVVGWKAYDVVWTAKSASTQVQDYTGAGEGDVVVTIPDGATGTEIAQILLDSEVVATKGAFIRAFDANANSGSIQSGTYTLRRHMSGANAVAMLLDRSSKSAHTLTVPEGATKDQVRDKLVEVGGYTAEEVEQAFADTAAIGLPEVAQGNVEGWLMPGTYDVSEEDTATTVVARMVSSTMTRLEELGASEADYEVVLTKASIVEREASPDYYAQVARVIDNRLADTTGETKGVLGMDSTVLYGVGRTGGIPTQAELEDASNPYNTRIHAGLPPSPIGSPSDAAITAVLHPAEGTWLYFVTVNLETGETVFATTLAEQEENQKMLTAYCETKPDVCGTTASPSPAG